jgi:hypothetical protein
MNDTSTLDSIYCGVAPVSMFLLGIKRSPLLVSLDHNNLLHVCLGLSR